MNSDRKKHWETVYKTKNANQVSWTQEVPKTSLEMIYSLGLEKDAKIIDIGGGDSKLVDHLLREGFINITVLDISANALERAKKRLGEKADQITWIVNDVTDFEPDTAFDIWHDRATFHFLTSDKQISTYIEIARKSVTGFMTIGTFSENGPKKCSGLEIKQYSEDTLVSEMQKGFSKINCITENHKTPFGTTQNFLFCSFEKQLN